MIGHAIDKVDSGAGTLGSIERQAFDNIGMGERDGYDLLRQVSGQLTAKEIPAAALTAFARSEELKRARFAGFQVLVPEP